MDKDTKFIIVLLGVIIVAALGLVLIFAPASGGEGENISDDTVAALSQELDGVAGIEIIGISAYSGPYFEDGSNEEVSGVMQLKLENNSDMDFQLLNLIVTDANGTNYNFKITTLLKGETMIVLESSRAILADAAKLVSVEVGDVAIFDETPSVYPDTFAFLVSGSNVTVQNLTDTDFGSVHVYYKNYSDGVAIGGITYGATISGLPAGEYVSFGTGNFNENTSKFVFVVYG